MLLLQLLPAAVVPLQLLLAAAMLLLQLLLAAAMPLLLAPVTADKRSELEQDHLGHLAKLN